MKSAYRRPFPYVSPFKDKRALLRAVDELAEEDARIDRDVARLVGLWQAHGNVSEGLALVYDKRGLPTVRWRATKKVFGHQRLIAFLGDEFREVRENLDEDGFRLMVGVESRRLVLNTRLRLAHNARPALEEFRSLAAELERELPDSLRTPFTV